MAIHTEQIIESKATGVYLITCNVTSKHYVGSSSRDVRERLYLHKRMLRENRHHSILLQRAYNKYGLENFEFTFIEDYPPDLCVAMEQYWMDLLQSYNPKYGYNIAHRAGSTRGLRFKSKYKRVLSSSQKLNISKGLKGKPKSKAHATKVGLANKVPIMQFLLDGLKVQDWDSVTDAAECLFLGKGNINACCNHKRPNAYGFKWAYKDGTT